MAADASAYAALGLKPGADANAIEQAYKRLIKQHHPDREGGDSVQAAEINRAYREIRSERHLRDPLELNEGWPDGPRPSRAWLVFALMLASATIGLLVSQTPLAPFAELQPAKGAPRPALAHHKTSRGRNDSMDQPLHLDAIEDAANEALRLSRSSDEIGLARTSRDCHRLLRIDPSLLQFDRCAAFDDAAVQLEDRDPLRDQGPFGELAVTGRVWSGASALSDDSLAIDGRLDRIRLRVELTLAPAVQSVPAKN
jgi:curved DNA-binding protein CbpA